MTEQKTGWLARLKAGLSRTSSQLTGSITAALTRRRLDQETLDSLEEALIAADLGVARRWSAGHLGVVVGVEPRLVDLLRGCR